MFHLFWIHADDTEKVRIQDDESAYVKANVPPLLEEEPGYTELDARLSAKTQ